MRQGTRHGFCRGLHQSEERETKLSIFGELRSFCWFGHDACSIAKDRSSEERVRGVIGIEGGRRRVVAKEGCGGHTGALPSGVMRRCETLGAKHREDQEAIVGRRDRPPLSGGRAETGSGKKTSRPSTDRGVLKRKWGLEDNALRCPPSPEGGVTILATPTRRTNSGRPCCRFVAVCRRSPR